MKKFSKKKLAMLLACASVLGNKTSAMNKDKIESKNLQNITEMQGGTVSRGSKPVEQGLTGDQKFAIGAAITAFVVVPAVAFTILGVKRNKNNDDNDKQNGEQAKIAQKNLEIIHKKFDDFYPGQERYAEKAKKVFDGVKSQMSENTKFYIRRNNSVGVEELDQEDKAILRYFVDILNGKVELDGKNAGDVMLEKPPKDDDFAFVIYLPSKSGKSISFGFSYNSHEKKFCFGGYGS